MGFYMALQTYLPLDVSVFTSHGGNMLYLEFTFLSMRRTLLPCWGNNQEPSTWITRLATWITRLENSRRNGFRSGETANGLQSVILRLQGLLQVVPVAIAQTPLHLISWDRDFGLYL
jgi:hypothetical protein